jgi:hypothetical protein
LTNRAFRFRRGLVGGLALLVATGLAMTGLSGCGAPAYTYVADSPAKTYYKVPSGWHSLSGSSLDDQVHTQVMNLAGTSGLWYTAFDADQSPSGQNFIDFRVSKPFVAAEVVPLRQQAVDIVSYDFLRDFLLPVTTNSRQAAAQQGNPLSNFSWLRDDQVTGKGGVHGVRETFQYTLNGVADTWDEDVLTNANQNTVYFLVAHCTTTCYAQNRKDIDAVLSSFTVGSS